MVHDALLRLQQSAADARVRRCAQVQPHPRAALGCAAARAAAGAAQHRASTLSAWRGLYRWWGRSGEVRINPVDGVRAPKAPKPLPKALSVDQAVALADHRADGGDPALRARDHCIVELLYGCGLRVGELVGLDLRASDAAARLDRRRRRQRACARQGQQAAQRAGGRGGAGGAARLAGAARRSWRAADEPALFVSRRGTPAHARARCARG